MDDLYNGNDQTESGGNSHSGVGGTEAFDAGKGKSASVQERIADVGHRAEDKINAQREPAARTLENTARTLRESTERVTNATSRAARSTADKLEGTASYLRQNELRDMAEDVMGVVRRYPGPTLAAAAVVGFLLGKALTSSRD